MLHRADMEQVDLAYKLDVTPQQINKYVNDIQRMSIEVAKNIATIL
ncbi:MAG: helix-turn-helix transcriptional regulator, partial [Candidatus Paceibacterota bacterium]